MKRFVAFLAIVMVLVVFQGQYFAQQGGDMQQSTKELWDKVNEATAKGLPKSAIKELQSIIQIAVREDRDAEAIKAIGMRVALESSIQGGAAAERIDRLEKEVDSVKDSMKPVMKVLLANAYWQHFQQNRWRYQQRTEVVGDAGEDINTWDLGTILGKVDEVFTDALSDAESLKSISVQQYDALLDKGNVDDAYRPTLYDVLVHNALEFYSAGEQHASRRPDFFIPNASGPILSNVEAFVDWVPRTTDTESTTLKAIKLYQDVLRFHQDDTDRRAFADADLKRIVFAESKVSGDNKKNRYRAALMQWIENCGDIEVVSLGKHFLAMSYHGDNELVKAHEIAKSGQRAFPVSVGGRRCANLVNQIEMRELAVVEERIWNQQTGTPPSKIEIRYRNLDKVYFRLVPFDYEEFLRSKRYQSEQFDPGQYAQLGKTTPTRAWSVDVPETKDFQSRSVLTDVPQDLPKGAYFLIASGDESFSRQDNQIALSEVFVSDLALVIRTDQQSVKMEGFVLEAQAGTPVASANVECWSRQRDGSRVRTKNVKTDADGFFQVDLGGQSQLLLVARYQGDMVSSSRMLRSGRERPSRTEQRTRFLTDRSIYRPGQTIQYKGICHTFNQETDTYATLPHQRVVVTFFDANNQQIEQVEHQSNAFGSFSGNVTAPADQLTGRMTLRVSEGPSGAASIRVEQYKRPKFKAELQSPEIAARLNDSVKMIGKAEAYSGAPVDDATVSWRVVRNVRYPDWWYFRCWWQPPQSSSQEIAQGRTSVNGDGTFEVDFEAVPDLTVPKESEPVFHYTVHADVTDATGETRSASKTIRVGYTSLVASIAAEKWLVSSRPCEFRVRTTTLDDVPQSAAGRVKVHVVIQPDQVVRKSLFGDRTPYLLDAEPDEPDPAEPNSWRLGEVVQSIEFETEANGRVNLQTQLLRPGIYRAILETEDRFGTPVHAQLQFQVLDPESDSLFDKVPELFVVETKSLEPGDEFRALWGTGYEQARVFVEIEHRGEVIHRHWSRPDQTQMMIRQTIDESMRGGLTLRTTMVRENRLYSRSHHIHVPWSNKQLTVKWEHFRNQLEPGSKETWTASITGPNSESALSELAATLYDASLDAYQPHRWSSGFDVFRNEQSYRRVYFSNVEKQLQIYEYGWRWKRVDETLSYRHLPSMLLNQRGILRGKGMRRSMRGMPMAYDAMAEPADAMMEMAAPASAFADVGSTIGGESSDSKSEGPDLSDVQVRENLNETAFFFPHLESDDQGNVKLEFTMPESLTEWNFMAFSHDNELRAGLLADSAVTQKDIMVEPNPPRFVREGDAIEFTVKVSNLSPTRQTGTVRLSFLNARTEHPVDQEIENVDRDKSFQIPAGASETFSWRIKIPNGTGWMIYRAVASTGRISDGQQDFLPVLSRRTLVTESIALPIRDAGTESFAFKSLLESVQSDTLEHQSLTVQMTSNPAWYAVMALPFLMEDPYQCNEQTFNRLYANSLAALIANHDPKIKRVFDQWRGTDALDSPLEKHADLKNVMLQETPWLRQGQDESAARRNVGVLFDSNRLASEQRRLIKKLTDSQLPNGGWSWFPGGRENQFITLYLTTGFGRLRHLGVAVDVSPALKALTYLDDAMTDRYKQIAKEDRGKNHLTPHVALYLYGRSFFLKDQAVDAKHRDAIQYWRDQATEYWVDLANRQSQAHLAVALKRFGDRDTPQAIMKSIKERSVSDEELGMFWRDTEQSWWWYRAPIETQAMMIEAFDEVVDDAQAVKDCKVWLLKQKQTQDWKTTKATADAVYALLLRGTDLLTSSKLVSVELAGRLVEPSQVEAGTGFYQNQFTASEVSSAQGDITVTKVDEGVAWGSVHWQYLEDVGKIKSYADGPLTISKQCFVKANTEEGPKLLPINDSVAVGDELVTRIVLRSDRDMEYLHLKDQRGSGTEPTNVLSGYRFQDGLAYYESTQDAATHFFVDYLPKGTYVFEYSVRVQHRGRYQSGMAQIQCMYAPEFNSHSESVELIAR